MGFKISGAKAEDGYYDFTKGFRLTCSKRTGTVSFLATDVAVGSDELYRWTRSGQKNDNRPILIDIQCLSVLDLTAVRVLCMNFALLLSELYDLDLTILREDESNILYKLSPIQDD